jgi:acetoacetyl-CoA synthetase
MARDYIEEIRQLQPEGPYALCGWSFGGNIAYEMARQLEQGGETVALVALLDSTVRPAKQPRGILSRVKSHAVALGQGKVRRAYLARRIKNARELVENAVGRRIVSWRREGYWVPRALQSVRQANKNARRIYETQPYRGKLTIFTPTLDTGQVSYDTRWHEFALGGIDIVEVGGTHHTMVFEPHCRGGAAAVGRGGARARNAPSKTASHPAERTRRT